MDYPTGSIEVAKGVYAFIQPNGATDAGFIVEEEGVIVIDTLMTPTLANRLMSEVRKVTDAPFKYVINTHWHGDHTFGNSLFQPAPVLAHDTCREDLQTQWDSHYQFLQGLYPETTEELSKVEICLPDITFSRGMTIHLGPRPIQLRFYDKAHTRGDVVVYLPTEGVLFAGDISFHGYIPNARDGYPLHWVEVAAEVEKLDCETIVPGHGPLGKPKDLRDMKECLALINSQVKTAYDRGMSEEEAQGHLKLGAFATWGRQEDRIPPIIQRLYREFKGKLK